MSNSLKGKVALIMGGTTGIGLAVTQQLTALGVRVVMAGRDPQKGQEAVQVIGDLTKAIFVPADVTHAS